MRSWQWLVPLTTVATIVVNGLANALPIANRTTGDISDSFPVLITPAGYVFAIWGLIYLGLAAYAVWQALPDQASNPRARALAVPVSVGNLANLAWILLWHHLWIGTSLIAMLVLLVSLMLVYLRLRPLPGTWLARGAVTRAERIVARGTFSVYLGWITVATVANVTIALYDAGWDGGFLPAQAWGVVTLVVATALGARMLRRFRDLPYAAVLVWAFVGIVVAQSSSTFVAAAAVIGALLLVFLAVVGVREAREAAAA